jgi:hypothetical protein
MTVEPFSAGIAWDWIQIAVGLGRLGHDVYFVEELESSWAVDHSGRPTSYAACVNRPRFMALAERFGLGERACQLYDGGRATTGLSLAELMRKAEGADLLLNVSGHLREKRVLERVARRAYLDQDPVYTQLWVTEYGEDLGFGDHDVFFTVGLDIGSPTCPIPTAGVRWHPMLPPVVLDFWAPATEAHTDRFTTVASLTGYAELRFEGRRYGSKYAEFRRLAELPRMTGQTLEVALKAFREDDDLIRAMRLGGWTIADGGEVDGLEKYRAYIAASRAEIGVAQQAYVAGRSGWFSDRSAHYLASGKPVLAQATGFERHLPVGRGLLAFATADEAKQGIDAINADYDVHCTAARELAEEHLDYRAILPPLLDACMSPRPHDNTEAGGVAP